MTTIPRTRVIAVAAAVTMLAACTTGPGRDSSRGSSRSPARPAAPHDPPYRFDTASPVPLPLPPVAAQDEEYPFARPPHILPPVVLHETKVFAVSTSTTDLKAVDVTTGGIVWTTRPRAPARKHAEPIPPIVATLNGTPAVIAAFRVTLPESGTTPSLSGVEAFAVNPATGKPAWIARVDTSGEDTNGNTTAAKIVGIGADTVVLASAKATYALDTTTGRLRWQRFTFTAAAVTGDQVIGVSSPLGGPQQVTAIAARTGRQTWRAVPGSSELWTQPAGPELVAASGRDNKTGNHFLALLNTRTGRALLSRDTGAFTAVECRHDQTSVTVCSGGIDPDAWVVGYDTATGRQLWHLPDTKANRVAPTVTAAWHGAVYATTNDKPVVLDARTGAQRPGSPGIAPFLVNSHVGIAATKDGTMMAHRTSDS